jgi:hypothetical protein
MTDVVATNLGTQFDRQRLVKQDAHRR